jgi:hypothetical protein
MQIVGAVCEHQDLGRKLESQQAENLTFAMMRI